MTTRLLIIIAPVLLVVSHLQAEEPEVRSADANEIFNSIMQTMPPAMKDRIDSAATTQRSSTGNRSVEQMSAGAGPKAYSVDAKQASIDNLPESVREQVRTTMRELENEHVKRMLEFKETRSQHSDK